MKKCEHEFKIPNDDDSFCIKCFKRVWRIKYEELEQKIKALEEVLRDFFEVMKAYSCTEISDEIEPLLKKLSGETSDSAHISVMRTELKERDSATDSKPEELIEEFLKSWDRFEKMFDKFDDVWHIENKVYKFIDEEKKKWEKKLK